MADVDYAVVSMHLAVRCSLATLDIDGRLLREAVVCAMLVASDMDHAVVGMLLAVHRYLAALDAMGRFPRASGIQATLAVCIDP